MTAIKRFCSSSLLFDHRASSSNQAINPSINQRFITFSHRSSLSSFHGTSLHSSFTTSHRSSHLIFRLLVHLIRPPICSFTLLCRSVVLKNPFLNCLLNCSFMGHSRLPPHEHTQLLARENSEPLIHENSKLFVHFRIQLFVIVFALKGERSNGAGIE